MNNPLGCNTLYPYGRLENAREQFGLEAQKDSLRILKEVGLDACEFSHYEYLSTEDCTALHSECETLGITPWSAHSWVQLPAAPADVGVNLPSLQNSLQGAAALGAQVVVVHASRSGVDLSIPEQRNARFQALEATLTQLAQRLDAAGMRLAIENCGDRADLEFLVETVEKLDLPSIGFNIDTGHAVLYAMPPEEAIRLMGARLNTTHLQDNFGKRDDHLPPGEGSIDWAPVFQALRDVAYTGTLMVEISDCPPGREPDAAVDTLTARRNLERLARG